jgi:hypothetical protein
MLHVIFGNDVSLLLLQDLKNGKYAASVVRHTAGEYEVSVFYRGKPVTGSPVSFYVETGRKSKRAILKKIRTPVASPLPDIWNGSEQNRARNSERVGS